jgi:hypothetical protein
VLVLAALLAIVSIGVALLVKSSLLKGAPRGLIAKNFRGEEVAIIGGTVIVSAVLSAEALLTLVALLRTGTLEGGAPAFSPTALPQTFLSFDNAGLLMLVLGFYGLGLLDDLAESTSSRGLRGHIGSLVRGRVTTGAIKAVGGICLAFVVAGLWELSLVPAVVDALVIALSANLLNLLDLRPGRSVKVFLLAWVPLAMTSWTEPFLAASAAVAAAAVAWMPSDLREKGMLGDSGANVLGAVVGAGVALQTQMQVKLLVLGILLALTFGSERWSFTRVIAAFAPFRWVDEWGRRRPLEEKNAST